MREQLTMYDKPIFLDETGFRWRLLRVVLLGFATGLVTLPIILALSIMRVEVLAEPSRELQQQFIAASPIDYRTRPRSMTSHGFGDSHVRVQ